ATQPTASLAAASAVPSAAPLAASSAPAVSASGTAFAAAAGSDVFSRPIAAAPIVGGHVLVAGLVVAQQTIRLVSLSATGTVEWSKDVLSGVRWRGDSKLAVFPTGGGGAAVLWVGERNGKVGRMVAIAGASGDPKGDPFEIDGPACATQDTLYWTESPKNAP